MKGNYNFQYQLQIKGEKCCVYLHLAPFNSIDEI